MLFVLSSVTGLFVFWLCFSPCFFCLGLWGGDRLLYYKGVFKHKGKNKPKAVRFILPAVRLVLGIVPLPTIVLLCVVLQVLAPTYEMV